MKSKKELLDTLKNNLFKDEENDRCYQSLITQIEYELVDNASKSFMDYKCQLKLINSNINDKDINIMLKLIKSHYSKQNIGIDVLKCDIFERIIEINVMINNYNYTREDLKLLYNNSLSETVAREANKILDEINLKFEKEVIENKNINYVYKKDIINDQYTLDVVYNIMSKVNKTLTDLNYIVNIDQSKNQRRYNLEVRL